MKAIYSFPQPVRTVAVPGGELFKVYDFPMPEGMVGFMRRFATPMVDGGYGILSVDGEAVTDPDVVGETVGGKIVDPVDMTADPPVVAERGIKYEFFSPRGVEITFAVEGELWEGPKEYRPPEPVPVYVVPKAAETVVESRREEAEAIPVKVFEAEKVRVTDTHERENVTMSEYSTVWEKRGVGEIKELWVKAESTPFELAVFADGRYPYYGDYAYYSTRSVDSEDITAEQRGDEYVIHIQNVKFKGYAALMVIPSGPVRFTHIYVKYEVES